MKFCVRLSTLFLLTLLGVGVFNNVLAQSYEISVRQVKPSGNINQTLCLASEHDTCFTTITIEPLAKTQDKNSNYLDIGMRFTGDKVNFNFMWNRDYAFVKTYEMREQGVDLILKNGEANKTVLLMIRSLLEETDPHMSAVFRRPLPLAWLELSARRID